MSIVENEESNLILSHVSRVETIQNLIHTRGDTLLCFLDGIQSTNYEVFLTVVKPNTHYIYTKKYYSNSFYVKINKIRKNIFFDE